MRKKIIVIIYILALLFSGIAAIMFIPAVAHLRGEFFLVIWVRRIRLLAIPVGFSVGGVLGFIAWIGALVKQGRQEQWVWFVCTLLFGGLVLLIYLIAVPESLPQLPVPGYGQVYPPQPPTYYPPNPPSYPSSPYDAWRP